MLNLGPQEWDAEQTFSRVSICWLITMAESRSNGRYDQSRRLRKQEYITERGTTGDIQR